MKINTDGVLIGALAGSGFPSTILDIGTGTGVIALMLAQRYPSSSITAVEMDDAAAQTAGTNFSGSPFRERLKIHTQSFQNYFAEHPAQQFDLIVSNPPFYIQSLPSPRKQKALAKHADSNFFKELITGMAAHLTADGQGWLIAPLNTISLILALAEQIGLHLQQNIDILSYPHSEPHRRIVVLGQKQTPVATTRLCIYDAPGVYNTDYRTLLSAFLTIF
ncbi:methyltransferase [Mucilaginibacter sp. CSA2-8R]|uniref:tRNA1(Val) (adenine(37)-N6)-methyltransferase n=1 Tax=Mucilaginibacter sp. CSA2-8R TaxID=3141542 RepID=UPI00315D5A3C